MPSVMLGFAEDDSKSEKPRMLMAKAHEQVTHFLFELYNFPPFGGWLCLLRKQIGHGLEPRRWREESRVPGCLLASGFFKKGSSQVMCSELNRPEWCRKLEKWGLNPG